MSWYISVQTVFVSHCVQYNNPHWPFAAHFLLAYQITFPEYIHVSTVAYCKFENVDPLACGRSETGSFSVSPCPLCIVLWSSSVNANVRVCVCVSDSRPPIFQAYPSECSPFTQHSSRGSMGKWAGVGACCVLLYCALCDATGLLFLWPTGPLESTCQFLCLHATPESSLLEYLSFAGQGDCSHICGNRGAFLRWMCDLLVNFCQEPLDSCTCPEWALSLRRFPRSGCVVETAWIASRSHGLLSS